MNNRVKDSDKLQVFYNEVLGAPFTVGGQRLKLENVNTHRRAVYNSGMVPNKISAKETGAKILGISVLLTFSIHSVKKVIEKLIEEGLRKETTVLLGGYPIDEKIREFTGADYYETDAIKAVELFKKVARPKT